MNAFLLFYAIPIHDIILQTKNPDASLLHNTYASMLTQAMHAH